MAAIYATIAELTAYAAGYPYTLPSDDAEKTALIERAQADLDSILGDYEVLALNDGLKIDPDTLDYAEDRALTRATCAQALYRLEMGEDHFIRPPIAASGPEFSQQQAPSHVGPQTWRELAGSGLLRNTTSSARRAPRPSWLGFAYNIED